MLVSLLGGTLLQRERSIGFRHFQPDSLIADGTIHSSLTLAEAKSFLARFNGRPAHAVRCPNVTLRLRQFKHFVCTTSERWTATDRDLVLIQLQELAVLLECQSLSAHRPLTPFFSPVEVQRVPEGRESGQSHSAASIASCGSRNFSLPCALGAVGLLNNRT